jgi:hypothetical protein
MFADREHVDRARAAITDAKDGDKKPALPNVIPSFKANALDIRKLLLPSFSFPLPLPLLLYFIYSFSSFKAFLISRKVSLFGAELYRLKPSFVIHSSTKRQAWPFHLGSSSETHHFVHFFVISLVWAIRLTAQFFWFLAILLKVEEAFKNFCYMPYTSLSLSARMKAVQGKDELILNANGSFTVKNLDRRNEKLISVVDWHAAFRAAKERICFHHGDYRTDTLQLITNLSWTLAARMAGRLPWIMMFSSTKLQHSTHLMTWVSLIQLPWWLLQYVYLCSIPPLNLHLCWSVVYHLTICLLILRRSVLAPIVFGVESLAIFQQTAKLSKHLPESQWHPSSPLHTASMPYSPPTGSNSALPLPKNPLAVMVTPAPTSMGAVSVVTPLMAQVPAGP